jgi:hypothetical protein
MDLLNPQRAAFPDYFGREIDFVVGWANTRTELHYQISGLGTEAFNHLSDRVCDDAELGTFASRMHQADRRRSWIYDVNGATIGNVNAERDTGLIGDEAVARGDFAAINSAGDSGHYSACDNGDFVSVDLFGGEQRPIADANRVANLPMCGIEPL